MNEIKWWLADLYHHKNVYKALVTRDFNGKYKNCILGYSWHLVNPLMQMIILYAVFCNVFGNNLPDYWVYLASGLFAVSFFSECLNGSATSIVNNSGLVTKINFPREIVVFSQITVCFISMIISYGGLVLIMACGGLFESHVCADALYAVPIALLCLLLFATGLGLILSALNVYDHDVAHVVGLINMIIMFATPIFYSLDNLNSDAQALLQYNPLVYYLQPIRDCLYYSTAPDGMQLLLCFCISISSAVVGMYVFKKLHKGFAERL